jgi:hypothetical protein
MVCDVNFGDGCWKMLRTQIAGLTSTLNKARALPWLAYFNVILNSLLSMTVRR